MKRIDRVMGIYRAVHTAHRRSFQTVPGERPIATSESDRRRQNGTLFQGFSLGLSLVNNERHAKRDQPTKKQFSFGHHAAAAAGGDIVHAVGLASGSIADPVTSPRAAVVRDRSVCPTNGPQRGVRRSTAPDEKTEVDS